MLTWIGLIGRTVEYVGRKLLDKTIDAPFDRKRLAANNLISFYDCLLEVEICTRKLIKALDLHEDKPVLFARDVIKLAPEIEKTSKEFIRSANLLAPVLEIYEPGLAKLLFIIYSGKGFYRKSLDIFPHATFEIRAKAVRNLEKISYNMPNEALNHLDLDQFYLSDDLKTQKIPQKLHRGPRSIIKVSPAHQRLKKFILRNTIDAELRTGDIELIIALSLQLEQHLSIVQNARELIRLFISKTFTINDLLRRS